MDARRRWEGWASDLWAGGEPNSWPNFGSQQFIQEGITVEYLYRYLWYLYNYINIYIYILMNIWPWSFLIEWWLYIWLGRLTSTQFFWRQQDSKLAFVSQGVEDCQVLSGVNARQLLQYLRTSKFIIGSSTGWSSKQHPRPAVDPHGSLNVPIEYHPTIGYMVYMATIRWCPIFPNWDSCQPLIHVDPKPGPGLFQVDRGQGGRRVFRLSALSVARDWTEFTHRMLATINLHKN